MAETILITGASSDIGVALMHGLLAASADVQILAHSFRGGERIAEMASRYPDRVVSLQADLSNAEDAMNLAQKVLDTHGTPMSVVHLPALKFKQERFTKLRWEDLERDLAVQVRSLTILLQRFLPAMAKLPRARVVFMLSSVVHGVPPKFVSQYTVVKYAQLGLMRGLAAEYATTPVRINAVSPSMVNTQFLSDLNELTVQGIAAANPLGRNAVPEDVVGAIQFLLSPAADYISGIAIPVAAGTVN